MSKSMEFTGKTIEEAIAAGLEALSLTLSEVDVTVLEEPTKGLFGLFGKTARVMLVAKDEEPLCVLSAVQTPSAQSSDAPTAPQRQETQKAPDQNAPDAAAEPLSPSARTAVDFLEQLFTRMNSSATIQATQQDEIITINVSGDPHGILIGHRGETMEAIQYLTNLRVNMAAQGYHKVQLDVERYRQRRAETLARLAEKTAARVIRTGRKVILEPMNPYERHILHATLQDHPSVTTHSEGNEPNRRVVIAPRD